MAQFCPGKWVLIIYQASAAMSRDEEVSRDAKQVAHAAALCLIWLLFVGYSFAAAFLDWHHPSICSTSPFVAIGAILAGRAFPAQSPWVWFFFAIFLVRKR
jgi:hypothetical protein